MSEMAIDVLTLIFGFMALFFAATLLRAVYFSLTREAVVTARYSQFIRGFWSNMLGLNLPDLNGDMHDGIIWKKGSKKPIPSAKAAHPLQ
ncbi:MAG: hypothetical protein HWE25_09430 [Alphaproteobacteria bacterium]|nr:hypothetical protein [Alphaproteobacteria bacterium]